MEVPLFPPALLRFGDGFKRCNRGLEKSAKAASRLFLFLEAPGRPAGLRILDRSLA